MRLLSVLAGLVFVSYPGFAALSVTIAPKGTPNFLVGTPIVFQAAATDSASGALSYQYSVASNGHPYQVLDDYSEYNYFVWTPEMHEGSFSVQVIARNKSAGETATAQVTVAIKSRITNGQPVISATGNPLVALYSAPACATGSSVLVYFGTGGVYNHTTSRPCITGLSNNFFIAGMLPQTTYTMFASVVGGSGTVNGPVGGFKTGALPSNLTFPTNVTLNPVGAGTDTTQNVLLIDDNNVDQVSTTFFFPTATDLSGNVIWFYGAEANVNQGADSFIRPVKGGTILGFIGDPNSVGIKNQIVREFDLAGNNVRETSVARVSEQLNAAGLLGMIDFDHDALRLPNGHTLVLGAQEKIFPAGTQGSQAPVDIIGNEIVDLDQNLQVVWSWSSYDHLDINRAALLGETCTANQSGCPPVQLAPIANDWLHGNSIDFIPSTGDILVSLRHQDWLIKINYANGTGDGTVVWKMGADGSFAINSQDHYPWFSHQHNAQYQLNGTTTLSLFDNGNTRVALNPGFPEHSRGYVLNVDEPNLTVTPILLQDLGVYSMAVGSAQRLDNGDYHFTAGFIGPPTPVAQHSEYTLGNVLNFLQQTDTLCYRGYRMESLYLENAASN